jgi:hypothetical protein
MAGCIAWHLFANLCVCRKTTSTICPPTFSCVTDAFLQLTTPQAGWLSLLVAMRWQVAVLVELALLAGPVFLLCLAPGCFFAVLPAQLPWQQLTLPKSTQLALQLQLGWQPQVLQRLVVLWPMSWRMHVSGVAGRCRSMVRWVLLVLLASEWGSLVGMQVQLPLS